MITNLYKNSREYARRNDEIDLWRDSYHENERCAKFIRDVVNKCFDGCHLTDVPIESTIKEFGMERTEWVIANTIKEIGDWDKRISRRNFEWADGINIPKDENNCYFRINLHSCQIDGLADQFRKISLEQGGQEQTDPKMSM